MCWLFLLYEKEMYTTVWVIKWGLLRDTIQVRLHWPLVLS